MALAGMTEEKRLAAVIEARTEMEELAAKLRDLIASQPPRDLLGYIYATRLMGAVATSEGEPPPAELIDDTQFVLEYVHAVLAVTPAGAVGKLDESACAQIFEVADKLKGAAFTYAMASSAGTTDGAFGPETADLEFRAKSTWVMLRGNRYQVLEGEFYAHVLAPHDDALKDVYGVGADGIAKGFQTMADALRTGHAEAAELMAEKMDIVQNLQAERGLKQEEAVKAWQAEDPEGSAASSAAIDDILFGGICNVTKHSQLPALLLEDLCYERGEETDFYSPGDFSGTPFRTLPARKKPLIRLNGEAYAPDPSFARDSGYRALLFNLLQRRPDYKKTFENRQKEMGEAAFAKVLDTQLAGARIDESVYYKDPTTHDWAENDTLVRMGDVLILIEAKAGAAATIASPALDFPRHVQAVQDLVVKAYKQCQRFLDYLNSADEVPIFALENGKYVERDRLRRADYRVIIPIGLTVESFSPFSTMCKDLPGIEPLLGKHPFISMSIDDLFVLKRFLPTTGELMHYLEVRQAVAAMKSVQLFDELDHLGAYIEQNRVDMNLKDQLSKNPADFMIVDGMSAVVDRHFERVDWDTTPPPAQPMPDELVKVLAALDVERGEGWLRLDSLIRDYGFEGRNNLAARLQPCRVSLSKHPHRYFLMTGSAPIFFSLQAGTAVNVQLARDKAAAAALACEIPGGVGVAILGAADAGYARPVVFDIDVPSVETDSNAAIFADAAAIKQRIPKVKPEPAAMPKSVDSKLVHKPGRNDPCPCGSGLKFKRCHGR